MDRAFAAADLTRTVTVEVGDISTFQHLIAHGLGIGFLPRPAFTARRQLRSIPLRTVPHWRLGAALPHRTPPNSAALALLELAKRTLS